MTDEGHFTMRSRGRGASKIVLAASILVGCDKSPADNTSTPPAREGVSKLQMQDPMRAGRAFGRAQLTADDSELEILRYAENLSKQYADGSEWRPEAKALDIRAFEELAAGRKLALTGTFTDAASVAGLQQKYEAVYARFPNTIAGEEAFLYHIALAIATLPGDRLEQIRREVASYLSSHPTSLFTPELLGLAAYMAGKSGDHRRAVELTLAAIEANSVSPRELQHGDQLLLFQAGLAAQFDVGDFDLARQLYARYIKTYPTDQRCFLLEQLVNDMNSREREWSKDVGQSTASPKIGSGEK